MFSYSFLRNSGQFTTEPPNTAAVDRPLHEMTESTFINMDKELKHHLVIRFYQTKNYKTYSSHENKEAGKENWGMFPISDWGYIQSIRTEPYS
jgi:hypothetical protein